MLQKKLACVALNLLEELCAAYDEENGSFPESQYEGLAIFAFAKEKLEGPDSRRDPDEPELLVDITREWIEKHPEIKRKL